jgi:glycosyltransferase involved in cell wall biosynthesis
MWGVSMPSRTYNILAVGKPILALTEADSELARVVEEEKVGWNVAPNEPEKLLETIYRIYAEREKLDEMGKRARKSAVEKYSLEKAVAGYLSELK